MRRQRIWRLFGGGLPARTDDSPSTSAGNRDQVQNPWGCTGLAVPDAVDTLSRLVSKQN